MWEDGGGWVWELAGWEGGEKGLEKGGWLGGAEGGWDGGWHRYSVVR